MTQGAEGTGPTGSIPAELFAAVDAVFEAWYLGRVVTIAGAPDERLTVAAHDAAAWVRTELGELLSADAEAQRVNPLQLLREASRFATPVLESMGAARPVRDEFESRAMPEDQWAVGPLAWIDLGDRVHEAGITWGAWKAATIISRHRGDSE